VIFGHEYLTASMYHIIVLLKSFFRHIINNFVADFNKETMSFWSDKSTPFPGNKTLICGNNMLQTDKPLVMGILNLTPDSFFDGGRYANEDAWISQTEKMIQDGASIIDLGAFSTRPGANHVSEEEEIERLIPVLKLLVKRYPGTVFSVDTFRSNVVKLSTEAGAGIINDISGGSMDPWLVKTVTDTGLPYILMHMQGTPVTMQSNPVYEDVTKEISLFFEKNISHLHESGIGQLILDPGFGFGKSIDHNYKVLGELSVFKHYGFPILVGISRKSMIYKLLEISPEEALPATSALHLAALLNGADILRVHDVKEAVQMILLVETLIKASK
jgi:dihydropteroate synthase